MRIPFGVILVSSICGGLMCVSAVSLHRVLSKDLDGRMYDSYLALSGGHNEGEKLNVISQVQEAFLDDLNKPNFIQDPIVATPKNLKQTYLLVKTRQRDKRYVSYLTLCHFKICNMGRKRTSRYNHMI